MAAHSLVVWLSGISCCVSAQVPTESTLRTMETPGGITLGVWGPATMQGPSPTLIVLATDIESTLDAAYYRQCGNALARHGYLCVSIDLPCHGRQRREGEPEGLVGWSYRVSQNEDFVAENNQRLAEVLDFLIHAQLTDPQRIAACGTSRGGFLAMHFAAYDKRVKCVAGFSPVTDLGALREFAEQSEHALVKSVNLMAHADRLADRPLWICIGDHDERVGTDLAIRFARQLSAVAGNRSLPSGVDLHVLPEPGGHRTPERAPDLAADWILRQLGDVAAGQASPAVTDPAPEAGDESSPPDRPMPLGDELRTALMLDRQSVADAVGVTFQLNQATKHSENPVLLPGEPQQWDSLQVIWPGTVLYDAGDKLFRCWYSGLDAVQKNRPPLWVPGYAESTDGIHWSKPVLGQHTHNGEPTNRIAVQWSDRVLSLVAANPDTGDAPRRFLAMWYGAESDRLTKVLASSPDGRTWVNEGTVVRPATSQRPDFFDISQLLFQPEANDENQRVLAYAQVYRPRRGSGDGPLLRQIGLLQGRDVHSLRPVSDNDAEFIVLAPEGGIDEEIHFATVKKVGDTFLMLFESDRFSCNPVHGDLRLAVSHDGRHFRRVHPHTPLVATGTRGMWDENLLATTTSAMQEVGDEIWIYYFGCPNVFRRWPYGQVPELRGSMFYPTYLGLAILPRDRFACAVGPGSVTTFPISIGQYGLWLNADGDALAVSLSDEGGAAITAGRLTADSKQGGYREVRWQTTPPPTPCRVRIELRAGEKLYSVRY